MEIGSGWTCVYTVALETPVNEARHKLETLLSQDAVVPTAHPQDEADDEPEDTKGKAKRPELSRTELGLTITELSEWMEQNPETKQDDVYQKWKSRKHGFSRPEIRFLLKVIQDLGWTLPTYPLERGSLPMGG